MMNMRIDNTYSNCPMSFGNNKGVLAAIEKIRTKKTYSLSELQAQLYDIENTPDFAKAIRALSMEWKNLLLKLTDPTGLIERFKEAGSNMESAQDIQKKLIKCNAVLKEILNG